MAKQTGLCEGRTLYKGTDACVIKQPMNNQCPKNIIITLTNEKNGLFETRHKCHKCKLS